MRRPRDSAHRSGQTPGPAEAVPRLATLDALWRSAVTLVRCGVAAQHPDWPEGKLAAETARRLADQSGTDGTG